MDKAASVVDFASKSTLVVVDYGSHSKFTWNVWGSTQCSGTSFAFHQCIPSSIPGPDALFAIDFLVQTFSRRFSPGGLVFLLHEKLERKILGPQRNKLL